MAGEESYQVITVGRSGPEVLKTWLFHPLVDLLTEMKNL
jgi:hypothetical protein